MKEALIIFTRNPIYGQVKTRLAATVGKEKALRVYEKLLAYTAHITERLHISKFIFYADAIETNDLWSDHTAGKLITKKLQQGNDLGEKMNEAFVAVFKAGYNKAVIIGTDCPELDEKIILDSFNQLSMHDVVIGPAKDGGYYLLGLKKCYPSLFQNISWSTNQVFAQTVEACHLSKLSISVLQELSDIDTKQDLIQFAKLNSWIND